MDRVILPTPSLEGLSWRERNALKMRNRGGQTKFVPSTKNPLLAKILALTSFSSSISTPAPTCTAAGNISGPQTEAPLPRNLEDGSPPKDSRHVRATSNMSCDPEGIQPVVAKRDATQSNRRRKTPASKTISDSDSDDPLCLSRAPKRKRRTDRNTHSKSGHTLDVAASVPSHPPPPEIRATHPASSGQAATDRTSQAQGEKATKATRKRSRQPTRSNKQQSLELSTKVITTKSEHEPSPRAASVNTHSPPDMEPGAESDGDAPILSASRSRKRTKSSSKDADIPKVPHADTIIRAKNGAEVPKKVCKSRSKARRNAEITSGSSAKQPHSARLQSNSAQALVAVAARSSKRRAKAVSESSEEDALIIAMPKRRLPAAASGALGRQRNKETECSGDHVLRDAIKPQAGTEIHPISRGASKSKNPCDVSDTNRRGQPEIQKKTKRPSFTNIEDSVDKMADEVNKRADEVVAIVKRVPLPPASSDIEHEKKTRSTQRTTLKVKKQPSKRAAPQERSLCPSVDRASEKPSNEATDDAKGISRPRLPRESSATTLVTTLSEHSQTSNSTLVVTSAKPQIRRPRALLKQIRESDSEADPLNL